MAAKGRGGARYLRSKHGNCRGDIALKHAGCPLVRTGTAGLLASICSSVWGRSGCLPSRGPRSDGAVLCSLATIEAGGVKRRALPACSYTRKHGTTPPLSSAAEEEPLAGKQHQAYTLKPVDTQATLHLRDASWKA